MSAPHVHGNNCGHRTTPPDRTKCQRRGCETKPVAGSDFCAIHGGGARVIG